MFEFLGVRLLNHEKESTVFSERYIVMRQTRIRGVVLEGKGRYVMAKTT